MQRPAPRNVVEEDMLTGHPGPIHVLIGENGHIHSHLLAETLKRDPRLRIVGSASSSREFLEIASHT